MFNKSYSTTMNGNIYNVNVTGHVYRDEHDGNVTYSDLDTIMIEDEQGNVLDDTHEDYDDLIEQIDNESFEDDCQE